ncbi:cupin domain-containing protein [Bacillus subtilis]|uniref:cupin domain-containing protein n=1 Tax=Bacillus subtilis TaxID=1423 RepID=UPI002DBBB59F|nr:cupin domain-containing protein [Bacillus subtilis]MEC1255504.1 cupin domain-containing protein [Bacillus subtilis]MEC1310420.1 cupin domain-containing protein [Bacillus subtilis]
MSAVTESVLESIISPVMMSEFLEEYWPVKPLVARGEVERFTSIPGFEKVRTLENVLAIYNNPVMVVGDAVIEESEGITDRFLVSPAEALEWYEKGAALEFDFTDLFIPQVRRWIEKLKAELRLPAGTSSKAIVYAAKNGGGFKAHFDAYTNLIFQIQGEKTWKLAKNENVSNPMQHYDLSEAPYYPDDLQSYWKGDPPKEDLPDAEIVNLTPGTMLYLPRGLWHSTKSDQATLALNITFGQPAWLDLMLAALRKKLISDNRFRELAVNHQSLHESSKSELNGYLESLIQTLSENAETLTPEQIFQSQDSDFDPYQSTQLVFRQLLTSYKF